MSEAREYPVLDLSAEIRGEGVGMWLDGDDSGSLTVAEPDDPGEIPTEEPVVWLTLEREEDGSSARMSGFVPASEFASLVEWASEFDTSGAEVQRKASASPTPTDETDDEKE